MVDKLQNQTLLLPLPPLLGCRRDLDTTSTSTTRQFSEEAAPHSTISAVYYFGHLFHNVTSVAVLAAKNSRHEYLVNEKPSSHTLSDSKSTPSSVFMSAFGVVMKQMQMSPAEIFWTADATSSEFRPYFICAVARRILLDQQQPRRQMFDAVYANLTVAF